LSKQIVFTSLGLFNKISGLKSLSSQPNLVLNFEVSNLVIGAAPLLPSVNDVQEVIYIISYRGHRADTCYNYSSHSYDIKSFIIVFLFPENSDGKLFLKDVQHPEYW
jgi:hypothetical protein